MTVYQSATQNFLYTEKLINDAITTLKIIKKQQQRLWYYWLWGEDNFSSVKVDHETANWAYFVV